jgi:FAD/FMN-containing dehydrogenase
MIPPLVTDLTDLLGPAAVVTGSDAAAHLEDPRRSVTGAASIVVRPRSHDEVAMTVELSRRHGAVIVPQGGNTGMSGGQIPAPGDRPVVVLATTSLRRVVEVNAGAGTVTAEAGVTIQELRDVATAAGWLFGPDWGARGSATLGGAIATNAGGSNVVRYGPFRHHVLGVRAVLADGRTWDGLRSLRKDSSGYDLKQLLIGSEGTLGIVTAAVVALRPPQNHVTSAWARLRRLDDVAEVTGILRDGTGDVLTAVELIPGFGVARACRRLGVAPPLPLDDVAPIRSDPCGHPGRPEDDAWFLLVRLAGTAPVADLVAGALSRAAESGCVADAVVAATTDQEERLWLIRDELSPSRLFPLQHRAIKGDLAVPVDRMTALLEGVGRIQQDLAPSAMTYGFGHVGDGNLHLYVLPLDGAGAAEIDTVRAELTGRIDELVLDLGGTLSGEHGIGRELTGRVARQKPPIEWELMRAVKAVLDPDNRLNPGVLLPPER